MPTEVTLWLTPEEAASGVTRPVRLPGGLVTLRIPPVQDGSLLKVPTDQGEAMIRIRLLAPAAAPPPAGPKQTATSSGSQGAKMLFTVVCALGLGFLFTQLNHHDSSPPPAAAPTLPVAPTYRSLPLPNLPGMPSTGPAAPAETPFTSGTCLNGTIPDSTTPVSVSNVHQVSCNAADAHYRVIETFHGTTDMHRCDANSDTQYSYSYQLTRGGMTINSVVYCLVGLGSYAR